MLNFEVEDFIVVVVVTQAGAFGVIGVPALIPVEMEVGQGQEFAL